MAVQGLVSLAAWHVYLEAPRSRVSGDYSFKSWHCKLERHIREHPLLSKPTRSVDLSACPVKARVDEVSLEIFTSTQT